MAASTSTAPSLGQSTAPVTQDTPILIKISIEGDNRKFKLPLKCLTLVSFADKIRDILQIPTNQILLLERFSDSSACYVPLDASNPSSYKQLYRAAKTKLKLRLRATVQNEEFTAAPELPSVPKTTPKASTSMPAGGQPIGKSQVRNAYFTKLAGMTRDRQIGHRMREAQLPAPSAVCWQICCNNCDKVMNDVHFNCSTCDNGDYDLCEACVACGVTCSGEGHWLVKCSVKNGSIVNSTTERLPSKPLRQAPVEKSDLKPVHKSLETGEKYTEKSISKPMSMPGDFNVEEKIEKSKSELNRTCNACVRVLPERTLITCIDCDDYDICMPCHVENTHGHHPGHSFEPISPEITLSAQMKALCAPGRGLRHVALCDGCDESIVGVRHKCLTCPDWDFCSDCQMTAGATHPGHRFVPLYDHIGVTNIRRDRHHGIFCDGPLCAVGNVGYITGTRYKCSVCEDVDFCDKCQVHPYNRHNQTHPLIMLKTSVRLLSCTTTENAIQLPFHINRRFESSQQEDSSSPLPAYTPSAEIGAKSSSLHEVSSMAKNSSRSESSVAGSTSFDAHFIHDTVVDGTKMQPSVIFEQTWRLKNTGSSSWPLGLRVHHVGGDNMLNLDHSRPFDARVLDFVRQSNCTDHIVAPGSTFDFTVCLRAPVRQGKHISYWRLKTNDGLPFGHKLWCDIDVDETTVATEKDGKTSTEIRASEVGQFGSASASERRYRCGGRRIPKGHLAMMAQQPTGTDHLPSQMKDLIAKVDALRAKAREAKTAGSDAPEAGATEKVEPSTVSTTSDKAAQTSESTAITDIAKEEATLEDSAMVFPVLEKESPSSSTYQDAPSLDADNKVQPSNALSETASNADIESVDFDESDDETFLTDDEYDILDASDEEAINGRHSTT